MNGLDQALAHRLADLKARGLYRQLHRIESPQSPALQVGNRLCLNFSSNDYLGLANDPAIKEAATAAISRYGGGSGAARLICGSLAPHHQLEDALATFKGTEAALAFASGYAAALGTIPALAGSEDIVIIDKLVHACLVDAARLSGAKLRVFPHNDLNRLEDILRWTDQRRAARRAVLGPSATRPPHVLIVTESVFSMDGDLAPLRELAELKNRYGAWLMVDEAHATGLYGPRRRGLAEALGVADQIDVQMGTLGKALGAAGGFIGGSRMLVDYLINQARSFIFSTAPVPAAAAAATAGVRFVQSQAGQARCAALWARVAQLRQAAAGGAPAQSAAAPQGAPEPAASDAPVMSAILPLIIGHEAKALATAAHLRDQGIFVPAVRYPTVPRGTARLRITLTATHTAEEVDCLIEALRSLGIPLLARRHPHAPARPA